jgi:hypothetical protein
VLLSCVLSPPTTTRRGRISFRGTSSSRVTYQCPPLLDRSLFLFLTFYPFSGSKRAQSFILLYCCRASKTPPQSFFFFSGSPQELHHTYHHRGDLSSIDTRTWESGRKEMEATDRHTLTLFINISTLHV